MRDSIIYSVIGVITFISVISVIGSSYNSLINLDEQVKEAKGNIETVLQRKADLIPNLVKIIKKYAEHERNTLREVIEARAKATQIINQVDAKNSDIEALKKLQKANQIMSSALGRLMIVVERYPQLKADRLFISLSAQVEGADNRIAVARRDYNKAVKDFNTAIRSFPTNLINKYFVHLKEKVPFEASDKAHKPVEINFD